MKSKILLSNGDIKREPAVICSYHSRFFCLYKACGALQSIAGAGSVPALVRTEHKRRKDYSTKVTKQGFMQ